MKRYFKILFLISIIFLGSCSGNSERKEQAAQLVAKAQNLVDAHRYDSALVVLDTLNIKYRDCLDERREGTLVRLQALSSLTRDSLAAAEINLRGV